ncbi:TetR/AcrR family transcriptional regulator [Mangrovitalea sediminis]|uniref:TetR/AcrR family transcriptional regulator n=1 Tax=Mangrovitalea sediminis TaxID=1982043 RepID=UPI000BE5F0E0|nr:TetR/AcrR family transcriptional regulator [Mangrovitalea sediminis]
MTTVPTTNDHRQRLLAGLADTLAHKAYRDITLADLAASARVSRRTFYEHFANKDACLLALCEDTSRDMMQVILHASAPEQAWPALVRDITRAYLTAIQAKPALMKALYIELASLGETGLAVRRRVAEQFAGFLQQQVERQRLSGVALQELGQPLALAIVTGINELILYALSDGRGDRLLELAPTAEALIFSVAGR